MKKVVLFASGSGSNAENILNYFNKNKEITVVGIFTNNPDAKVLDKVKKYSISTYVFSKQELESDKISTILDDINPDLIVLAGFLLKFPTHIVNRFQNKILNIHPALLPKYGGKGMYGLHIHNAVLENKETETGITIHYVNQNYDEGAIIFQKSINIEDCKTVTEIASKVLILEHLFFPEVIEKLLTHNFQF